MAHSAAPVAGAPPAALDRSEKRDLASWWKNFKGRDRRDKVVHEQQQQQPQPQQQAPRGIFGVPLQQSILYANVAISLLNDEGQSYIYGYVPIVVAKCGVYLKEKATDVEGIFRLAGNEKRIKQLKAAFDSPDRYGKGLDWTGYTVHDAANILRRYFNQLPEPIIPLEFYEPFRDPLRNHQEQAVGVSDAHSQGSFDKNAAIRKYQRLITELPPLHRQLLLYILDLLAVFASKSDMNKMTTANLSAIFQPGILSHPQHDMAPQEYRLSQDVLIFLIENQDHFLIGMQGTGADPETIRGVQSGAPTPPKSATSPSSPRLKAVGRTASNASAGAESVARWGSLRRNVSVSSRNSKPADVATFPSESPGTPTGSPGVHRSNTVPSRRGGSTSNQSSPRFSKDQRPSDPSTPLGSTIATAIAIDTTRPRQESLQSTPIAVQMPQFPDATRAAPEIISPPSSEATTPHAVPSSQASSVAVRDHQTPKRDTTPLLAPPSSATTGSTGRGFLDIFKQSPTSDGEGTRKPNKLQKKARVASSTLSSAHSSSVDLHQDVQAEGRSAPTAALNASSAVAPSLGAAVTTPQAQAHREPDSTGAALRPTTSPTGSYHSTTEDTSDADFGGDDLPHTDLGGTDAHTADKADKVKRRHRWRFSRTPNRMEPSSPPSGESLASGAREVTASRSTIGSTGARRSFQDARGNNIDPALAATTSPTTTGSDSVFSDSERERRTASTSGSAAGGAAAAGPMQWIRGKLHKEKGAEGERRVARPGASPPLGPTAVTPATIEPLSEPEKAAAASSSGEADSTNAKSGTDATSVAVGADSTTTPTNSAPIGVDFATGTSADKAAEPVRATSQTV